MKSLGKKMDNSRYGFDAQPASRKQNGAFGREERQPGSPVKRPGRASALGRMRTSGDR